MLIYILCFLGTIFGLFFVNISDNPAFFMGLAIIFFTVFTPENTKNIKKINYAQSFIFFVISFFSTIAFGYIIKFNNNIIFSAIIVGLLLVFMRLTWSILCKKLAQRSSN